MVRQARARFRDNLGSRAMQVNKRAVILNINGDPQKLTSISSTLRQANFEVHESVRGNEALLSVQTDRPQLIILEVNLPDINGLEICRRIKEDPATSSIPVVQIASSAARPDVGPEAE